MRRWMVKVIVLLLVVAAQMSLAAGPKPGEGITKRSRCPVCGMFVAKYPHWLTQVNMSDGQTQFFDGVKDMMAYYFGPQQFGAEDGTAVDELYVRDYYSLEWIDGRKALYVIGSDVYGPMGHELIPFADQTGAMNFQKDHHGSDIYSFSEITSELIESLRKGHTMGIKK